MPRSSSIVYVALKDGNKFIADLLQIVEKPGKINKECKKI